MLLTPGLRLGSYEVLSALGAGGMGEVYRAHDGKLGRDVALKVLPESVGSDAERLARFRREAQVLASLNHPNVAQIYGFEDSGDTHALVMELVDGETLAERIARGPLPIDEALAIARQIIEGVQAAHDQGIVHRDLKPANVKLRPDGTVKVLDFGLAKLADPATASTGVHALSLSPTITSPVMATGVGVLLGTAAYMSPEQAKGRVADRRSDVWAFGCVLYEMLTGRRAFEGEEITETLAAILKGEPDWSLIAAQPPVVRLTIERCVARDPRQRLQDIGDVRLLLDGALTTAAPAVPAAPRARVLPVAAAIVLAAVSGGGAWLLRAPAAVAPPPLKRFTIALPDQQVFPTSKGRLVSVTADGQTIVYVALGIVDRVMHLYRRRLDGTDAVAFGEPNANEAALSPDGRFVAYAIEDQLMKVPLSGGASQVLATFKAPPRGVTWLPDGSLVTGANSGGLRRVPAGGGTFTEVTKPDAGHIDHDPYLLSDHHTVLYTSSPGLIDTGELRLLDLPTGKTRTLIPGIQGRLLANGMLAYVRDNTLWTVPFDIKTLTVSGTPTSAVQSLRVEGGGAAQYAVSDEGTLLYIERAATLTARVVEFDRSGQSHVLTLPARTYNDVRLSPDGTRAAFALRDQERDIWIWDFSRQLLSRLTLDPAADYAPAWTPDGKRVVFTSRRGGSNGTAYWQAADGTGAAERLVDDPRALDQFTVSPDGRSLVAHMVNEQGGDDIGIIDLTARPRQLRPLIATRFNEGNPSVSPDGHWLVYASDESGRPEVYVRPFPNVDAGRWQVSTNGGRLPRWTSNGREILFVGNPGGWWIAPVITVGAFTAGTPRSFVGTGPTATNFAMDASTDGTRVIALQRDEQAAPNRINVVLNWFTALRDAAP